MQKIYTPEEWHELAKSIYDLINSEIESVQPEHLNQAYPKIIVMYEFFRLLRGEAFLDARTHGGVDDIQPDLYAMEDALAKRLAEMRGKIDSHDGSTVYHLDQMKKSFEL
jgi:hypothetical protein